MYLNINTSKKYKKKFFLHTLKQNLIEKKQTQYLNKECLLILT